MLQTPELVGLSGCCCDACQRCMLLPMQRRVVERHRPLSRACALSSPQEHMAREQRHSTEAVYYGQQGQDTRPFSERVPGVSLDAFKHVASLVRGRASWPVLRSAEHAGGALPVHAGCLREGG
jgi:hypothetical protein